MERIFDCRNALSFVFPSTYVHEPLVIVFGLYCKIRAIKYD